MPTQKNKLLLIWPPLAQPGHRPLGIPSLVAYLKNHGTAHVDVLDMNVAYLKSTRSYWFFFSSIRRGCAALRKRLEAQKSDDFLKKVYGRLYDYLYPKLTESVSEMRVKVGRPIPWSLKSILSSFRDPTYTLEQNKVRLILKNALAENDFSLVGISVLYPEQLFFALLIAQELKERYGQSIHIVLGGAQVTKHAEVLIQDKDVYRLIDFLVVRDGEEPLLKLLSAFPEKNFLNVPNLYAKDPQTEGAYQKSEGVFFMHPHDFLVPDFMGFEIMDYEDSVPLMVSKGCPWAKCSFCSYASMRHGIYYAASPQRSIAIIKKAQEIYGAREFYFLDDALLPKFMGELAEGLIRNQIDIKWGGAIMLRKEFGDPDFCRCLTQSGLAHLTIGFESTSNRILKLMNKYQQNLEESEILGILKTLKKAGIKVYLDVMFGFPTETLAEARATLDFLINNIAFYDYVYMQPFCLEENTPVADRPEEFGITKIYRDDKNRGSRLGYRYDVREGMSQEEAAQFVFNEARKKFIASWRKRKS